jgi:uncharacterized protein YgiM (DUF1202 family)
MAKVNMPSKRVTPKKVDVVDDDETSEEEVVVKKSDLVKLVVANCKTLNIRNAPSKESNIVRTIKVGTVVYIDLLSQDTSWLHITGFGDSDKLSTDSKPGYILAEYTSEV